ncbi:MAG: VOC family protein [Planctomycetota bacterium]|nr:VOC family protein [Planctomycetaceae bacterium]MDQ3331853.1 VOC family protein [Planctomycetota bacterium]
MKVEHVALQVPDALATARWYVEHLGLTVKMRGVEPPYGHFLADDGDAVMLEIYSFADVPTPQYASQEPRQLHLALISKDVAADVKRLISAGASLVSGPESTPKGDEIAMLRDPWGVCIQLVLRAKPMLPGR